MVIDESISETVPLSKVLDQLLDDQESCEVILTFLQMHEDVFKEIIEESNNWLRIFQLDFILDCNESQQEYILSKLKLIPAKYAAFTCWQICKIESRIIDRMKFKFKKEFDWILKMFDTKHPYSSRLGQTASNYDRFIFNNINKYSFAEILNSIVDSKFKRFMNVSFKSIFKFRLFQYDVFCQLNVLKQFLILKFLEESSIIADDDCDFIIAFIKQILSSDENVEIKYAAINAYANCKKWHVYYVNYSNLNSNNNLSLVDVCQTYPILKMKMLLNGILDNTDIILELFLKNKKDILVNWAENDSKDIDENIKVSELVKFMNNKKLFK